MAIIELSHEPLERDDWVCEDVFYENFVGAVASYVDYVSDDQTRKEVIERFGTSIAKSFPNTVVFDKEAETLTFKDGFRKEHDRIMTEAIKKAASKDCDDYREFVVNLRRLIDDRFGWWVYRNDGGYETEQSFLRWVQPGTYYFGGVIYYHS